MVCPDFVTDAHAHVPAPEESGGSIDALPDSRVPPRDAAFPESAPFERSQVVTAWRATLRSDGIARPLLPPEEAQTNLQYDEACFLRYVDFVWTNYGQEPWQAHLLKRGDPDRAADAVLRELLFDHPRDRVSEFIKQHHQDVRMAERAREVLYRGFYTWAFEHSHTQFNPEKYANVLPFIHMDPIDAPECTIVRKFCEFMASPVDALDIKGAGMPKKIAQQLTRSTLRFIEYLWKQELAEYEGSDNWIDPSDPRENARRLEARILTINRVDLETFLESERERGGGEARNRASSAIKKYFIPFLHEHFNGPDSASFEASAPLFPNIDAPACRLLQGWREHLEKLTKLPPQDPDHISQGTAHNRDYVTRRYLEYLWAQYGLNEVGQGDRRGAQAGEILNRLACESPHDGIQAFIAAFTNGDPTTDISAQRRLEKVRSGLRLLYKWANDAELTSYDFDNPEGSKVWFRSNLPQGIPPLRLFDGFCAFLGAEVDLRARDPSSGIEYSTAKNYRVHVARFIHFAWNLYSAECSAGERPKTPSAEEFGEVFRNEYARYIQSYLQQLELRGTKPLVMRGVRSALNGVFKAWVEGSIVHIGRLKRQGQSDSAQRHHHRIENNPKPRPQLDAPSIAAAMPAQRAIIPAAPAAPALAETSIERRKPLPEPRLGAILKARNMAIDFLIGRGRGQGQMSFSELCRVKMNEYDEQRGYLVVQQDNGGRKAIALDQDSKAIVNEYVRLIRNSKPFLSASIKAGSNAPLFMSADGGSLVVSDSAQAVQPLEELREVFRARDGIITALIREAGLAFNQIVEFAPPFVEPNRSGTSYFHSRSGPISCVLSTPLVGNIKAYAEAVRGTALGAMWDTPGPKYFFQAADGLKLTGDSES